MLSVPLAPNLEQLVLIGGGEFSFGETREIDRWLLERLPSTRKIVAFLPTASGSAEYAVHIGKYFSEIDPDVQTINVPIYRGRDNRRPRNLDLLRNASMIYLGGGVTNNLLAAIRESPAEAVLREAASGIKLVAAIGAAASCFGTWARDMRGGAALPGLGWLPNTVVETGFDAQNDTMLRRLMSLEGVSLGLGIPPKTAVVISQGGDTEILGGGQIAAFRKQ